VLRWYVVWFRTKVACDVEALTLNQSLRSISIVEDVDHGNTFWYFGRDPRRALVSDAYLEGDIQSPYARQRSNILTYWRSSRRSWRFATWRLVRCHKLSRVTTCGACTRMPLHLCSMRIRAIRTPHFRPTLRVALRMGTQRIRPQDTGTMGAHRCQDRTDSHRCRCRRTRVRVSHRHHHHTDVRRAGRRSSSCRTIAC
jgi:hypothetical protein